MPFLSGRAQRAFEACCRRADNERYTVYPLFRAENGAFGRKSAEEFRKSLAACLACAFRSCLRFPEK